MLGWPVAGGAYVTVLAPKGGSQDTEISYRRNSNRREGALGPREVLFQNQVYLTLAGEGEKANRSETRSDHPNRRKDTNAHETFNM